MIDEAFEQRVLACLYRSQEFGTVAKSHLKASYFENPVRHNMGKIALDFLGRYGVPPSKAAFVDTVADLVKKKTLKKDDAPLYVNEFKALEKAEITDWAYVLDRLIVFIKNRETKRLIEDAVKKYLPRDDFDSIEKAMAKISAITTTGTVEPLDYWDEKAIDERIARREEEAKRKTIGISTGIKRMDKVLAKNGWYEKELYVILAPPKRGKCVTRDTMVYSEDGLVEIGDYVPEALGVDCFAEKETSILGMDGIEKTSHVYNSGLTATKKIVATNGMSLEGTPHHPVLTMKNGEHVWKRLDELCVGDWLVSKVGQRVFGKFVDLSHAVAAAAKRHEESSRKDVIAMPVLPTAMTEDLAEFLAMFVAEGYSPQGRGDLTFTQKDAETLVRYKQLVKGLFGIEARVVSQTDKPDEVRLSSVILKAYLEALGVVMDVSKFKTVPRSIRTAPEPFVRRFLNVLLSLEGAVVKSNKTTVHYELTMASEKLIRQVQMMLLNYGIESRLVKKPGCATNGYRVERDYWRIKTSGVKNLAALKNIVGLHDERKHALLPDEENETTRRDWVPETSELVRDILEEIKASGRAINSLFSKAEHYSLNRFAMTSGKHSRMLTVSFAERLIAALDVAEIKGEASDKLRYIVNGAFRYTKVDEITDGRAVTVDFSVPKTHSFLSNGLISHNTMSLLYFANMACWQGFNAAYFTLEVSKEVISERLDAMNANMEIKKVSNADWIKSVGERLKAKRPEGNLKVFEYPTKSLTVSEMKRQVRRMEIEKGQRIDIIFADYGDIMKPECHYSDNPLKEEAGIFEGLRGVAGELVVPVVTASQVNRAGSGKEIITGKDTAGTWEKIMVADGIISLSATDAELAEGIMKVHFAESRNNPNATLKIKTAYNFGRFYQEYLGEL